MPNLAEILTDDGDVPRRNGSVLGRYSVANIAAALANLSSGDREALAAALLSDMESDLNAQYAPLAAVYAASYGVSAAAEPAANDDGLAAAISAAANAAGPKLLILPPGVIRTSDWIDIDGVSDLTIRGAGMHATIIKPADGADVGGFRIGTTSACSRVVIEHLGYDGNQAEMDTEVKRCHGFILDDATDCRIRACYITQTHPYHEHNSGGSGISMWSDSSGTIVEFCLIEDIGDRGIEMAGEGHIIRHNVIRDGYDRSISLDVQFADESWAGADGCFIHDNVLANNSDGSLIAVREHGASYNSIVNNHMSGAFRGAVQFDHGGCYHNHIEGNFVRHEGTGNSRQPCFILGPDNHLIGNTVIEEATLRFAALVSTNPQGTDGEGGVANRARIADNFFDAGSAAATATFLGSIGVSGTHVEVVNNRIVNFSGIAILAFAVGTDGYRIEGNYGYTDETATTWIESRNANGVVKNNYLDQYGSTGTFSTGIYDFSVDGNPDVLFGNIPPVDPPDASDLATLLTALEGLGIITDTSA